MRRETWNQASTGRHAGSCPESEMEDHESLESRAASFPAPSRGSLRSALIKARLALTADDYARRSERISAFLRLGLGFRLAGRTIGLCWPWRGEFDMRPLMASCYRLGARVCLPDAVMAHQPMHYLEWRPDSTMRTDRHGIAVPNDGAILLPELALVPVNGFDEAAYRLGYGGGYFDRTLATMAPRPIAVGVGFECARVASLRPESHDIPMDFIVTEAGIARRDSRNGKLGWISVTVGALWIPDDCPASRVP